MFGLRAMFVLVGLAVALTAASPMEKFNKLEYLKPVNTLEETYDDPDPTPVDPTDSTTDTTTDATTDTTTDATTDTTTDTTTGGSTTTTSDAPTDATTTIPSGSSAVYCSLVLVISSLFLL